MAKGGTWETTQISKSELTELLNKPIRFSDAYGMQGEKLQKALAWARRNGSPKAYITNRPNGLHGVALN